MRTLFALSGFHRVERGAEVALGSVARQLAAGDDIVTVAGSGPARPAEPYRYAQLSAIGREHFERIPSVPVLRSEYAWEEATFAANLLRWYRPADFDVTVTCGYPFLNWALRRGGRHRPPHVFVTQNGDWPAHSDDREFRYFGCEGLVCTNPEFFERNAERWRCALIPNGVDVDRFAPGPGDRARFAVPDGGPVVLMVSALIESKRVLEAMQAVARIPDVVLVVAGDGPLRQVVDRRADELLPGRFRRLVVSATEMPGLYRSADVFLHTTLHESFGNVYVEALSTGLPIVAHASPTLRWILGEHGSLVDTTVEADLVEALRTALARPTTSDEALARHATASSRFGWDRIAEQYRDFLGEVIAGR